MRILYRPRINIVPPNTCYGVLYNWYATQEDIAPDGWHVPTSSEWETLIEEIGGDEFAGQKLKDVGYIYWLDLGFVNTDEYGFKLLGSSQRSEDDGLFGDIKLSNNIWLYDGYITSIVADANDEIHAIESPKRGGSIRLIKDNSTNTGTMTDFDGNVYPTVKIGDQVWMAENLKVTHYNDGTPIPNVASDEIWTGLTSGAMCAYNNDWNYACVEEPAICFEGYGLIYNYYAIKDARKITSSDDWVVPAYTDYQTLRDYLGGTTVAGGKLKETGLNYWDTPNTGATNEVGFNSRGSGWRAIDGAYISIKQLDQQSVLYESGGASIYYAISGHNTDDFGGTIYRGFKAGAPIRLLYTGAGSPTTYTDNSGNVYRVVHIGTQYWLADNLRDTHFRNGDIIPYHGSDNGNNFTNAEWAALTTAGVCAYGNDVSNVGCDFTFPTE